MKPEEHQYPVDYLNQIAPEAPKRGIQDKKFLFIVGGGLLLALIVGAFLLFGGKGNGPTDRLQTLSARLSVLKETSDGAQKSIKSGELRGTNSNLALFLTNATRDIEEQLKDGGLSGEKLDKSIISAEKSKGATLKEKLEDARLNAVYDLTYAREMAYQLGTVDALISEINAKTNSKSLKELLKTIDDNITPINEQLTTFSAASS